MGKFKRIWHIFSSTLMIGYAVIMMLYPDDALTDVSFIVSLILLVTGLKYIFYYMFMAQHMVGGKVILYYGVFLFDLGAFAVSIMDQSKAIIIIYLIAVHLFAGVVDIVRSLRNRKEGYPVWRSDMGRGVINVILALICLIFMRSTDVLVYVYSIGLIYLAVLRIGTAFKKTAIVYIQ